MAASRASKPEVQVVEGDAPSVHRSPLPQESVDERGVSVQEAQPVEVRRAPPENQAKHFVQIAIEKGLPVESIKELIALSNQQEDRQAKKDYIAALTAFQSEVQSIKKTGESDQFSRGGAAHDGGPGGKKAGYQFLELDVIADTIREPLTRNGFSYSYDMPDAPNEKGLAAAVLHLQHINGHVEHFRFWSPIFSKAGMSEQQKFAASQSYAKRYALCGALGLTGTERDTDGFIGSEDAYYEQEGRFPAQAQGKPVNGFISQDQVAHLEQLLQEARKTPQQLIGFLRVPAQKLGQLRVPDYNKAVARLEEIIYQLLLRKSEAQLKGTAPMPAPPPPRTQREAGDEGYPG